VGPHGSNFLIRQYWVKVKLPAVLKKIAADVFISGDIRSFANRPIAQCYFTEAIPATGKQQQLKYADSIAYLTESPYNLETWEPNRFIKIPPATDAIYTPIDWQEKDTIKEKYTGNKEYFLQAGWLNTEETVDLLKAFSFFKRRQQSGMKLVLTQVQANTELYNQLNTFKYRNDVVLIENVDDTVLCRLVSAAYAVIYLDRGFNTLFLNAMQARVPVLLSTQSRLKMAARDAVLYFEKEGSDLAEAMMLIYKDENLRSHLIEEGKQQIAGYTWQHTADAFWLAIANAVSNKKARA
jgi:glycosyltransferase involved in cell wall biosynthesis